jgi:imidazolonepropionase-like amidohydrolase
VLLRDGALADSPEARIPSGFALGEWPGIDHLDEAKIPGLVAATRRARAMVAPTMAVWRTLWGDPDGSALRALPELRYVPAKTREAWAKGEEQRARAAAAPERLRRFMEVRDRLLRAFADAGKLIMLAADSPQRYNVPGFAMRREVAALVKAGMTPAQVIEAATIAPARFLGLQREQGTVAVGRRADLLLLEADPLVDADNIFRQAGVMVNGRWLPRAELDARLAALERSLPQ